MVPMPRLTEETQQQRRRHVMESAWRCFARQGFQATTMDEIIAETGMSSSSVYRYFPGKDDLIASAAEESLGELRTAIDGLLDDASWSTPADGVAAVLDAISGRIGAGDPDMSKLAMSAWVEGLRDRRIAEVTERFYREMHDAVRQLAIRWQESGSLSGAVDSSGVDPDDVADLVVALMPGMIVTHHLHRPTTSHRLLAGMRVVVSGKGDGDMPD